jgi:monovalent cation:H+ antiporter, CPA1 family
VTASLVTVGMTWLLGWPTPSALVFGVLIAATDAVVIIAMFKDNGVSGRLRFMGRSIGSFDSNDGAIPSSPAP